jgi:hypothetical protein
MCLQAPKLDIISTIKELVSLVQILSSPECLLCGVSRHREANLVRSLDHTHGNSAAKS